MTVRCRSARALLIAALVSVGRNGWPASAGGTGRAPGTIGVIPGGGGGTETGRLPGPVAGVRVGRLAAAAGATGGGVTGRGARGGGITGSGATGGVVSARGITGALPAAAGSGRVRRVSRLLVSLGWVSRPESDGRLGCRSATGSGARREPAVRRPV